MNNNGELLQVFTPKFVHDTIEKMNNNAITREEAVKILTESDWLEPELLSEIQKHFPLSTDIDYKSGRRNKEAFVSACDALFPIGRTFSSSLQLNQATKTFLSKWAILKSSQGKIIKCAYGLGNTRLTSTYSRKTDHHYASLKSGCPFFIRFTHVGKSKHYRGSQIFFRLR